eukprot:8274730-Prorocentrum_lima.AAC.1
MQRSYPFRKWKKDVRRWEISQLKSTAKLYMQEEMDADSLVAELFQYGCLLYTSPSPRDSTSS